MAEAGFNYVAFAQVAADGLGLGRRFDDDEFIATAVGALRVSGSLGGLRRLALLCGGFLGCGDASGRLRLGQFLMRRGSSLPVYGSTTHGAFTARAGRAVSSPLSNRVQNRPLFFAFQAIAYDFFIIHSINVPA